MSDTIELLESIGRDASLRHASGEELSHMLEQSDAPEPLRTAVAAGDSSRLSQELGNKPMHATHVTQEPCHEDEPGQDDDRFGAPCQARSRRAPAPEIGVPDMPLRWSRYLPWAAVAAMAFCVLVPLAHAAMPVSDVRSLLKQAEQLRKTDRPKFLEALQRLKEEAPRLTVAEQWEVRYLEAAQTGYQGDYAKADVQLRDIIAHSNDRTLEAKASALLMLHLGIGHHYEEAFALANQWIAELPRIGDTRARYLVLYYAAQLMGLAGQNDLAIQYARMMEDTVPPGESLCEPRSVQITALFNSKALDASDPLLQKAVDMCSADKRLVFVNNIQLVLASLYLEKNQPEKALVLLRNMAPHIESAKYFAHVLTHKAELAGAYWKLGDDVDAEKAALAAVAMASPGEIDESYAGRLRSAVPDREEAWPPCRGTRLLPALRHAGQRQRQRHQRPGDGLSDRSATRAFERAGRRKAE